VSPIDLDVVPGLDTTAIRIARDRCYSATFREKAFFKGGKIRTRGATWKDWEFLYNTYSRISRNLKEFRSGAIRVGGHGPGVL
jgi:hypothetical protein